MGQLFYPYSLRIIQPFLEFVHYDLVNSLSLSIFLRISWSGIPVCDSKITIVSLEGFAVELKAIVQDKGTRDPEPCDNVFSNKFLGIYVSNICQRFSFNPLGEVVRADQQISLVSYCFRERPKISKPHWANGQALDRGLRTPLGWCIFGANLWQWSHFLTYSCTSFCIFGHQ